MNLRLTAAVLAATSVFAACAWALQPSPVAPPGSPEPAPAQPAPAQPAPGATPEPQKEEAKVYHVRMQTSMGDIVIELNNEKAPISTKNFLAYADKGFYDGTIFHRVISNFMIQGGGFNADMSQKKTEPPIKNESGNGLSNVRGSVAMARTNVLDSATAQFYINVVDNLNLDGARYAVFGRVISGMEVVDKIRNVPTGSKMAPGMGAMSDVPRETVTITKVSRITEAEAKAAEDAEKAKAAPGGASGGGAPKQ